MIIKVAKNAGFCFGVDQAVKTAYAVLSNSEPGTKVYMLGAITHNEFVVNDLIESGMHLANSVDEIDQGSTVIIRAHGVTPQIKDAIEANHCKIVDCTCPFVKKIHKIVKQESQKGKRIIITGKNGHPEVEGIRGEAEDYVTVVESQEDFDLLETDPENTILISQTTFSSSEYKKIRQNAKNKIANEQFFDTICSTTENRQREASDLAASSDCMIIIGSEKSSNTMKLYDICNSRCANTFLVGGVHDIIKVLENPVFSTPNIVVGVTAGASTPDCIIREVIQTMSEDQATANQEQTDINFGDYIDNIPQLRKNATVRGAITSADNEFVYVDVHDKSEGRIPRHEFTNDPDFDLDVAIEAHTEIEVFVRSVRNSDMGKEILLSKAHVDFGKYKAQVEEAFENATPVTVKITNVVKDGVIANLGGVDIYIHRTQLDLTTVNDLDQYKGKSIEILVTQFDPDKRRLRVSGSRRALLNSQRKEKADEVWSAIEVGAEYQGVVRSLTDFGAFVDIGGVDGLVHVSELSWKRIRHPSEIVSVGDNISVYVKDFDSEKKRISLGYKRSEDDPYHNVEERFPIGSIVHGKVVRMFQFGAFVELEPGVDALCHVSQISDVRLNRPEDVLTEGMEVIARVLDVSNETRRISISIKDVEAINPVKSDDEAFDKAEKEEQVVASVEDNVEVPMETDSDAVVSTDEIPTEEVSLEDAQTEEASTDEMPAEATEEVVEK